MKIFVRDKQTTSIHYFVEQDAYTPAGNEEEVTDIVTTENVGLKLVNLQTIGWRDRKAVRDRLKTLVYTKMGVAIPADTEDPAKWNLLTDEEKSIAVHWFLVGKADFQNEVKNDDTYWICEGQKYRKWTNEVRQQRLEFIESIVMKRMAVLDEAKQVLADMNQISKDTLLDFDDVSKVLNNKVRLRPLTRLYVAGLESEADDGVAALRDYLNSEAGTPFATNGFRNLTYSFNSPHTADTTADECIDVIDGKW
mgnify:FL=1